MSPFPVAGREEFCLVIIPKQMPTTLALFGVAQALGPGLAHGLATGPYRLLLCDDDFAGAQALAEQIRRAVPTASVEALACAPTASWEADAVILILPTTAHADLAQRIGPFVIQKLVLFFADPVHPVCVDWATEQKSLQALQQFLPHSKVRPFPARAACLLTTPALTPALLQLLHTTLQPDALG